MARYIQSHTIAPEVNQGFVAARGLAEPLDGITEVWFPTIDVDAIEASRRGGRGAALVEDERRFTELGRSRRFFTREHEVFDSI